MDAFRLFLLLAFITFVADALWAPAPRVKLFSLGWAFVVAAWLFSGSLALR